MAGPDTSSCWPDSLLQASMFIAGYGFSSWHLKLTDSRGHSRAQVLSAFAAWVRAPRRDMLSVSLSLPRRCACRLRDPWILLDQRLDQNQDGGVEGCALTPSCKNIRITTSCWTIIDRKTLELTKNIPHIQRQRRSHNETVGGAQSQ